MTHLSLSNAAVRLALAVLLSAVATLAVFALLPSELNVETDIVGTPTFSNFNIYEQFWAYGLAVVFFPLATLGSYLVLTRTATGSIGQWGPRPAPIRVVEPMRTAGGWREWTTAFGRTSFVGVVLGFQTAICVAHTSKLVLSVALAYLAALGLVASAVGRTSREAGFRTLSALNALAAPVTVAGLYTVSESTTITVSSSGTVRDYPWLPTWLALAAIAAVLVWIGRGLLGDKPVGLVERSALLLVVGPVALFLGIALLPGELGTFDLFEEGQLLAGADLTREGAFPWRDLVVAHGLLNDAGDGLLGTAVFEDSRWGLVAAQSLLLVPLYWLGLYYLCAFLFGINWLYFSGTQLLVLTGYFPTANTRFLLLPFVLLLLVAALQRATIVRCIAFTALLAVQVIVTPEALAAAVPYFGTLVLFELYYFERACGFVSGFRRVWICLATFGVLLACWSIFLAAFGALDDWLFSFRALIPGHELTGGIPLAVPLYKFEVVAPVVLVLSAWAYVLVCTHLRRPLSFQDWAMVAAAGLTLAYYTKFLGYADLHVLQAFSVAVPLLFYVGYLAITEGEARIAELARHLGLRWFPTRYTLTTPILLVLLALAASPPHVYLRGVSGRFTEPVSREAELERVGYARAGENDIRMISAVGGALNALTGPGAPIFDFTNAPGLFHYLLERPTSTRYHQTILAARRSVQRDLLDRLKRTRPRAAVFMSDGRGYGVSSWDGISNPVRHYDVSEYLLRQYVPVRKVGGYIVMARGDLGIPVQPSLYFRGYPCDWGFVPNFFSPRPDPNSPSVELAFRPVEAGEVGGGERFALTLPADAREYGWLEIETAAPLRKGTFAIVDRPPAAQHPKRRISFKALDRGQSEIRVKLGACPQWMGFEGDVVYLETDAPQDIRSVRLVR